MLPHGMDGPIWQTISPTGIRWRAQDCRLGLGHHRWSNAEHD